MGRFHCTTTQDGNVLARDTETGITASGRTIDEALAELRRLTAAEPTAAAKIIALPRTAAGREALRDALGILRNCGSAPADHPIVAANWDGIGGAA